jgi:AraC family transcriptional regulator of adaptative response / DNA-3-methyladenine glycosylase II
MASQALEDIAGSARVDPASVAVDGAASVAVDSETLWRAVETRDPRFDGWFFCAVTTTGIYCRPSCPARPKREHMRFFPSAAAAQSAGFRACKRCRPEATPGSPEWDRRADLVGRAMRLIADGVVDREGVPGLARRLGYTERQVHRELVAVVGAGPLAVARAQRAQTARLLLETTGLPITQVAFGSGFRSVRQFNDTVREVFATTPGALRERARRNGRDSEGGAIALQLPYRPPFDGDGLIAFFARRAVPHVEEVVDGTYRRSLRLPHGAGVVELAPRDGHVRARFWLDDVRDLGTAVQRTRVLLDLDSDPRTVSELLAGDPLLGRLVAASPGRRVPGHVDPHELAVRGVLGQQVSLGAAATLAARLTLAYGEPLAHARGTVTHPRGTVTHPRGTVTHPRGTVTHPRGTVTHLFPSAADLAAVNPDQLPMPAARGRALVGLASALADGDVALDAGADRDEARRRLQALPGIGVWTAEYVAMRALRDPDAFMPTDLGVRQALVALGQDPAPRAAVALAERWRPYRAYAMQHLWGELPALRERARAA